jgi:IS605 OrfB family transposase
VSTRLLITYETRLSPDAAAAPLLEALCGEFSAACRRAWAWRNRGLTERACYARLVAFGLTAAQTGSALKWVEQRRRMLAELKKTELTQARCALKQRTEAVADKTRHIEALLKRQRKLRKTRDKHAPARGSSRSGLYRTALADLRHLEATLASERNWLTQKRRALKSAADRVAQLERDITSSRLSMCFGSKALLAQRPNAANATTTPYESVDAWRRDWEDARTAQFWSIGRADEPRGNTSLQWDPTSNSLRIRLTDTLAHVRMQRVGAALGLDIRNGPQKLSPLRMRCRFLVLPEVEFRSHRGAARRHIAEAMARGQPITMRLVKRRLADGTPAFYLQASIDVPVDVPRMALRQPVIGIDLNASGAAWCVVKPDGNRARVREVPQSGTFAWSVRDMTTEQRDAVLRNTTKALVLLAQSHGAALAVENLNFAGLKAGMKAGAVRRGANRALSQLATTEFRSTLIRQAHRHGVPVAAVNPAYSSIAGYAKYNLNNRLSVDEAAALWLGRQALYGEVAFFDGELTVVRKHDESLSLPSVPVRAKRSKTARAQSRWGAVARALGPYRRRWPERLRALRNDVGTFPPGATSGRAGPNRSRTGAGITVASTAALARRAPATKRSAQVQDNPCRT